MRWYAYIGYFFAGGFLANALPHLVQGITGQEFRTPIGDPSPALVNVVWGLINLGIGYGLVGLLGGYRSLLDRQAGLTALGFVVTALSLGYVFSR